MKRCQCREPDPEPLKSIPTVHVCKSCRGWFAISGLATVAELELLRSELDAYGNYGGTD